MNLATENFETEALSPADYAHSIKIGVVIGFAVGVILGLAMIVYIDSPKLYSLWPDILSIPLLNGLGWALFGMIVGCGGLLAHVGRRERHEETEAVSHAAETGQLR